MKKTILVVMLFSVILLAAEAIAAGIGRPYDVIAQRVRECNIIKDIDVNNVNFPIYAQQKCGELNPRNIFCRNDCRRDVLNRYDVERKKKMKMLQSSRGEAEQNRCKLVKDSDLFGGASCPLPLSTICGKLNPTDATCQGICKRNGYVKCGRLGVSSESGLGRETPSSLYRRQIPRVLKLHTRKTFVTAPNVVS